LVETLLASDYSFGRRAVKGRKSPKHASFKEFPPLQACMSDGRNLAIGEKE